MNMNKKLILPVLISCGAGCAPDYQQNPLNDQCFSGFDVSKEFIDDPVLIPGPDVTSPTNGKDHFTLYFADEEPTYEDLMSFYSGNFSVAIACAMNGEIPGLDAAFSDYSVVPTGDGLYSNTVSLKLGDLFGEDCEVVHVAFLSDQVSVPDCQEPLRIYATGAGGDYGYFGGVRYSQDSDGLMDRTFVYEI